jgi:2-polyprenyl-3-methyl-5-hydroxy-6-metoxy-1,4-benzoquinol methylase
MNTAVCPACKQITGKIVYKKIIPKGDLMKCAICNIYFVWPKVSSFDGNVYNEDYYKAWAVKELGDEGLLNMKKATFDRLLDTAEIRKPGFSILDIGCAMGHLLEVAREKGFEPYGIDISQYSADMARSRIGQDRIWVGDITKIELPNKKFDVITAVDLIEHTYDVDSFFAICGKLLNDDGYLLLVTPAIDSLSHKLAGKLWHNFNEQHVLFLSRKSISNLLSRYGFKVIKICNFKKAVNFIYLKSVLGFYGRKILVFFLAVIGFLLSKKMKRKNFFLSQGEMLIITQKR